MTIRTGGSRGHRVESEGLEQVDAGTVVLMSGHIYFQGVDKKRSGSGSTKLLSRKRRRRAFLFQRDGVRARPETFVSHDVRIRGVLLHWLDAPEALGGEVVDVEAEPDEMLDTLAATEADSGDP